MLRLRCDIDGWASSTHNQFIYERASRGTHSGVNENGRAAVGVSAARVRCDYSSTTDITKQTQQEKLTKCNAIVNTSTEN